jgi:tetratricopeptide (TPR) repeat protein
MRQLAFLLATVFLYFSDVNCFAQGYSTDAAKPMFQRKDWRGLTKYGADWAKAEPNNGKAWYVNGQGAMHQGHNTDAVAAFQKATSLDAKEPTYWNSLAQAYHLAGNQPAAIKAVNSGELACPNTAKNWYLFANGAASINDLDHGIHDFQKAIAIDPKYGQAWTNMGLVYQMKGDNNNALQSFNKGAACGDKSGKVYAAKLQKGPVAQHGTIAQKAPMTTLGGGLFHPGMSRAEINNAILTAGTRYPGYHAAATGQVHYSMGGNKFNRMLDGINNNWRSQHPNADMTNAPIGGH